MKTLIAFVLAAFTFGAFAATGVPVAASAPAKATSSTKAHKTKHVRHHAYKAVVVKASPAPATKK